MSDWCYEHSIYGQYTTSIYIYVWIYRCSTYKCISLPQVARVIFFSDLTLAVTNAPSVSLSSDSNWALMWISLDGFLTAFTEEDDF